jgi:anti-sigma-K factor RskA
VGATTAVLTTEELPALPSDRTYQAWVRHGERWTSLGTFAVDGSGRARLIAENDALAQPPEAIEVTVEPAGGSAAPGGAVVLTWSP